MKRLLIKISFINLLIFLPSVTLAENSTEDQLKALADEYLADMMIMWQPLAYYYDIELNQHDKFLNNEPVALARSEALVDKILNKLRTIDTEAMSSQQELVFYAKFKEALETRVDQRICQSDLWNISHMSGPHTILDFLVNVQPLETDENKIDALARWNAAAEYYLQEIKNLKTGLKQGYSAPKRVVQRTIDQLRGLVEIELASHPYSKLGARANDDVFADKFNKLLENKLLPNINTYMTFLEQEYMPAARDELGIHSLPDGRACYIALYRSYTTLKRTPEEVHELGLKTVNTNKDNVLKLGKELYGVDTFYEAVKMANDDATQKFSDGKSMHDYYVAVVERAKAVMPNYFASIPSIKLEVEAIPEYQQGTGRSAHYVRGSKNRNAKFGYDPTTYRSENFGSAEIVSVHEGYPGHHLQIALVQEQSRFHPLESLFGNSAFTEGWARYAEALSEEAGIYQSKSATILRRAWPARGMVADTALHVLGWSNEEVAAFLSESGASFAENTDSMLDRMAAIPAQLTAYDSGALEIFALRTEMEAALGKDFDIKAFHQMILGNGNVPMAVLRKQVISAINNSESD
jgi:uncharacterized protein (DUF885 family)